MQKTMLLFAILLFAAGAHAQSDEGPVVSTKKHKMVIQLTTGDTTAQKSLVKQITNVLHAAPNTKIEVVCHNNGISFLQTDVTQQAAKIRELSARGIDFVACENTMRSHKIKREDLVAECRTVPSGAVEIMLKEEKKWVYLKAGN